MFIEIIEYVQKLKTDNSRNIRRLKSVNIQFEIEYLQNNRALFCNLSRLSNDLDLFFQLI